MTFWMKRVFDLSVAKCISVINGQTEKIARYGDIERERQKDRQKERQKDRQRVRYRRIELTSMNKKM